MAFTITDAAAWVTAKGIAQATVTSAAWNAASGDLILVVAMGDDEASQPGNPFLDTLTDSGSPDQTWTVITSSGADASCYMKAWWAIANGTLTGLTVTATRTGASWGANGQMAIKVYTVTGHDATTPIGNVWNTSNTSTTNNWSPNTYTSSVNNSRGFALAGDWNALGSPTSTDTESSGHDALSMSWTSMYKAADTATSGTAVAFNFDAGGTGAAAWRAIAWEIRPTAGAGRTALNTRSNPLGVNVGMGWRMPY